MSELLNFILDHEDAFKSRARLSSLWSDFPSHKIANPDGYAANISAWKNALFHASRAGRIPSARDGSSKKTKAQGTDTGGRDTLQIATGEELAMALEMAGWGRPSGLSAVIQDAVASKDLIPLQDFLASKHSIYSRSWIPTPWQVIQWSLRQIGLTGNSYGTGNRLSAGRFVVVENVEAAATAVLRLQNMLHQTTASAVYSLQTFTSTFAPALGTTSPALTASDISILLTYMSRDKPCLSYSPESQTIKFTSIGNSANPEITETDISIAQVKSVKLALEVAIPPLEARLAELDMKAREAVSKKQVSTARAALKSKKLVDTTLEKRRANLLQVEESLAGIEQAADNVAIVQAMKESARVMRRLNEQVGGVEGVERVTDALREEMQTAEEIGRVVTEPGAEAVDESAVDDEFEELVAEEKRKQDAAERAEREKKEAEERAVQEKRDKEKAEETRQRLAELEAFESKKVEEQKQKEAVQLSIVESALAEDVSNRITESPSTKPNPAQEGDEDTALNRSVEQLTNMSLNESKSSPPAEEAQKENTEKQAVLAS